MTRIIPTALLALGVCVSCATRNSNSWPYQPETKPEKIEFRGDRLDVYPDDVRKNLAAYTNVGVAWVGVIRGTDAHEEDVGDKIRASTVFEHHYFDWVEDKGKHGWQLAVSPRGEGVFSTEWYLKKTVRDAGAANAEHFAGPGKLAIVYGVPEKILPDGTIVLKYRYLRIIGHPHFTTNEFDYGRLGEPFHVIQASK